MIYRYLFHFFFALTARFPDSTRVSATNPVLTQEYIITKFAELPNLYEELRPQSQQRESTVDEWAKEWICEKIFGRERTVDPGRDEYRAKLQQYSPAIFEELFREDETPKGIVSKVKALIRHRFVHDNLSKVRTFLVGENERAEKTFACVLRNSDETQFEMYYVSDYDYNVNEAPNRKKLIGRFLFSGNRIYALAEEPPITHYRIRNTNFYQKKRGANKMAEQWENDPVCKLDRGRRFRLCRYVCYLIFNDDCEGRIAFQEQCTQKEYLKESNNESYEEWMLVCEITHSPTLTVEHLVARAYTDNNVHVFKVDYKQQLNLIYDLEKVAVVVDEADRT